MKALGDVFYRELGRKLREVRVQAGLRQEAVSVAIGFRPGSGQSYVSRLERGSVRCVKLDTRLVRESAGRSRAAIPGIAGDESETVLRSPRICGQVRIRDSRYRCNRCNRWIRRVGFRVVGSA